jgi:16S rRNA (guanine527-N7)-methyltransferase
MAVGASGRERALDTLAVSRETAERLDAYADLLMRWQVVKNLVAPATLPELWQRHILDSGQLAARFTTQLRWADFGSGAGLPGLVVAILRWDMPGTRIHLIESNQRKVAFLREAARVTGAPALIHAGRVEDVAPELAGFVDLVTARALAPMIDLLALAAPLLKTGSQAAFLKGQDVERELTQAAKSWRIEADLIPSLTDPAARIVHVRAASPLVAG